MTAARRTLRAAAIGTALLALAGCGPVARADGVEEQIRSRLGTDSAECPADLEGEVGRSVVCTAVKGDDEFDVTVTVTSVEGATINFALEPVRRPAPPPPASDPSAAVAGVDGHDVAQSVLDQLATAGKPVDRVSCPDLEARVGASQRCTLVSRGVTYGVTVTVTSVQGADVRFDIQVDRTPQ